MAALLVGLLLALASAASAAVVLVPCEKTLSGNGEYLAYACTFCNPTDRPLRSPRLNCASFDAVPVSSLKNLGYTSPHCYIAQPNPVEPAACTGFSFRAPAALDAPVITFDDGAAQADNAEPESGSAETEAGNAEVDGATAEFANPAAKVDGGEEGEEKEGLFSSFLGGFLGGSKSKKPGATKDIAPVIISGDQTTPSITQAHDTGEGGRQRKEPPVSPATRSLPWALHKRCLCLRAPSSVACAVASWMFLHPSAPADLTLCSYDLTLRSYDLKLCSCGLTLCSS